MSFSPAYTLSNFASVSELAPILDKIPADATPDELQSLRETEGGPSRDDGSDLIRKMRDFTAQAEGIYQTNLTSLDGMQELLSTRSSFKYLSLFEIADLLLPSSLKTDQGFSPPALYATHTAIFRNEFGFTPLSPSRRDNMFEILPKEYTHVTDSVAVMVRAYNTSSARRLRTPSVEELRDTVLGEFVLQAREVIAASRLKRQWTPHGIIHNSTSVTLEKVEWSPAALDILNFMEIWACYGLFGAGSRFHSYGATILRAVGVYENVVLDQNTAWTFLQELGVVSSWEISSRYKMRFPHTAIVKGGGLDRKVPTDLEASMRADVADGSRKDWAQASVFCIDAPTTAIIDDGVSLERTDKLDEFWMHIHTADPASAISPNSELCKFMELIPENIYLPGHFQAMVPSNLGEDESGDYKSEGLVSRFSLRPGSPALTFSAKVNDSGEILDFKIEPGTINNVLYLDPEDVSAFCEEPAPPPTPEQSLVAGTPPEQTVTPPNRPMITTKDLDSPNKQDLTTLYRLAEALRKKRLDKGAWPYFFPRASISVSFPEVAAEQASPEGSRVIPPDPYIKVRKESSVGCSVVSNSMVLAGEIAARWCSARNISIPYRKDFKSAENYPLALAYATEKLYPLIEQGIEPPATMRQELSMLTGGIEISSQPGPYFLLGLDAYAKATSPLRRFSDLLVHWQIHAALAHERSTGQSIDPAADDVDAILPFSSEEMKSSISLLHTREKMARSVARGSQQWILQALVRAWQFEKTLPRTMRFTIESRWTKGVMGSLDFFDLYAIMDVSGLNGLSLLKNLKVGEQFEVELKDVNVHSKEITVKALKYFGEGTPAVPQRPQQGKPAVAEPGRRPSEQKAAPVLA